MPGRVEFTVDTRHPDSRVLDRMVTAMRERCHAVAAERGVDVIVRPLKETPPRDMDAGLRTVLQQAADACGATWSEMPSGAGHDSQTMGTRVAAAMLFVPSRDGRSHSPAEYSKPEDCARGASVLATALHALAWSPLRAEAR